MLLTNKQINYFWSNYQKTISCSWILHVLHPLHFYKDILPCSEDANHLIKHAAQGPHVTLGIVWHIPPDLPMFKANRIQQWNCRSRCSAPWATGHPIGLMGLLHLPSFTTKQFNKILGKYTIDWSYGTKNNQKENVFFLHVDALCRDAKGSKLKAYSLSSWTNGVFVQTKE